MNPVPDTLPVEKGAKALDERDVNINIESIIKNEEGEDTTEFFTTGRFRKNDDGFTVRYDETDAMGYAACTVKITVADGIVTIERTGPAAATLIVEKEHKHHCVYGTPFGDFTMGINTYEITDNVTENGGTLYFKYSIDINSDFISENEMKITIS